MADIQPFKGLRPRPDLVQKVASPPYDVLSSQEAREMAQNNPLSFLRVVKAEIDLDPSLDPHSEEVYNQSRKNLQQLITDNVLIQDEAPCFYIYESTMGDHVQKGLMMGANIDEYEKGIIKKHEHTRPDKENDRAHHIDVLNANSGPVMMTYKADPKIDDYINNICSSTEPVYDFVAEDGVKHTLWVVANAQDVTHIRNLFKDIQYLYIADGHHRSAASFRVRNKRREHNLNHTGKELYNHFLAVAFPDNQLQILGYYRAVKDLHNLENNDFLAKLEEFFEVSETTEPLPPESHHFKMFLDGKWFSLIAKPGTFPTDDPVLNLDVSILQKNLLEKVMDLYNIRTNTRIEFIGGIRGTKELEKRCNTDMRVAFALYPTGIGQLMDVADKNEVMPPKSTWFEPKLRSGVVIRSLT